MSVSGRPSEFRGMAALVAGAICIGFAPIWVRWSEVGPVATAFHRLACALPVLARWALTETRGGQRDHGRRVSGWTLVAGVCFAIDLGAWHISIQFTSVANATLLANLAPIFVTLGAMIFLHERVGRDFLVGMGVALMGAWMLSGAGFGGAGHLSGDLLAVVTALFYGSYQLCVAR